MIESEVDKGTTFTLYLPASIKQEKEKAKQLELEGIPNIDQTLRILVVDDEEMVCRFITNTLDGYGFFVSTALDGTQAIDMYRESLNDRNPFDAVIMDLTIPGGMGGKEAIKRLLKIDPEAKCIVSSGYANDPVMANYTDYGFIGIITKPYTPDKLVEVLSQVLKK